ncbi:MAG: glycosyl hydrolase family 18 protein [Chlamydiota bacterium]
MKKYLCSFAILLTLLTTLHLEGVDYNYEAYLESWDPDWQTVYQGLPGVNGSTGYAGVVLDIAFAGYNSGAANAGLDFTIGNISGIVTFVHNAGGKVKLSFGGANNGAANYFISSTAGWPSNINSLATYVAGVINTYNLDGVDFDIEDPLPSGTTAQAFATNLIQFLQAVRQLLGSSKLISITIPGQGWNTYWYYLATGVVALGANNPVNCINFMEYDIWVNSSLTFAEQIEADLVTYTSSPTTSPAPNWSAGWGIPNDLIQLGLMPGCDDTQQFLSVAAAGSLASYVNSEKFYGVMIWDLDRDSGLDKTPTCSSGYPTGYEYSTQIRTSLEENLTLDSTVKKTARTIRFPNHNKFRVLPSFKRKAPPLHGAR